MPYQPFSKDTRLGKIADWSGNVYQDTKSKNRYTSNYGGGGQYAYYHDEDDTTFQTAGNMKPKVAPHLRNRQRIMIQRKQRGGLQYNPRAQAAWQQQNAQQQKQMKNAPAWRKPNMKQDYRFKQQRVIRDPLIQIKDHWIAVDEVDLNRLTTLSLPNLQKPVNLADFGELRYLDPALDKVNTKDQMALSGDLTLFYPPLQTDSVIFELTKNKLGNVFMSSQVASFLMCSPRSIYSWDLVAFVEDDDTILIDFRDNYGESNIELVTMNENAQEPPPESLVKIYKLEGHMCNCNFRRRAVISGSKAKKFEFPGSIPDLDEEEESKKQSQSFAFRYRLFDIGNDIKVVIRCELDAAVQGKNKQDTKFACVYALTECPTKAQGAVDWRSRLDTQAGAVLASELRNNSFKLARFTTRAILSGAQFIKLGFVSRVNPKDNTKHTILGVQQYKTEEFAQQIGYNIDNAWGILRFVIEHLKRMPVGCYLIQKDANKPLLRFHSMPSEDFLEEETMSDMDDEQIKAHKEKLKQEAAERLQKVTAVLGANRLGPPLTSLTEGI